MLTVRMSRKGDKKRPFYHIVVTDSENPRDGRFIELIGTYDPKKPMETATVNRERLGYWLSVGAKTSESLGRVLRQQKKALDAQKAS